MFNNCLTTLLQCHYLTYVYTVVYFTECLVYSYLTSFKEASIPLLHFIFRTTIFVEQFAFLGLWIIVEHIAYIRDVHEAGIFAVLVVVSVMDFNRGPTMAWLSMESLYIILYDVPIIPRRKTYSSRDLHIWLIFIKKERLCFQSNSSRTNTLRNLFTLVYKSMYASAFVF